MDIIITGAGGRLGRRLISELNSNKDKIKHNIYGIDRTNMPSGIDGKVKWIKTDIHNVDFSVYHNPIVVHLAALISYNAKYKELFNINVMGTKKVFEETMNAHGRMIFMSSTSVYGKRRFTAPIDETHERKPDDNYGLTKMYAEDIVMGNSIILRPCPIYGPGFEKGYFNVFDMVEKGRMKILDNGDNHVPVIHVDDVVSAIKLFIKKTGKYNIYNVTPEKTLTQKQLLDIVSENITGNRIKKCIPSWLAKLFYTFNPEMKEYINMLSSDRTFSNARLQSEGWKEKVKIDDGIKEMIKEWKRR